MKIVILGTGNVATVLGRKLKAAGHQIVQVFGRNSTAASELAYELDTESCNYWSVLVRDADVYILALTDTALRETEKELRLNGQILVHTAGSVSMDVLKNITSDHGVLYPLQSLRKEMNYLPDIPFMIEASTARAKKRLLALATSISDKVIEANESQRLHMHLAAVIVNNFTNHLYHLAEQYCKRNDLVFTTLIPLINETANRIRYSTPLDVQTGPAIRGDQLTIDRHLSMLADDPQLRNLYARFSADITANAIL